MTSKFEFGDKALPQRFWEKVSIRDSGCWEWTASFSKQTGYGWYRLDGKAQNPHRIMCSVVYGEPGEREMALHSCDNRICVNPAHLRWGSAKDNIQDAINRGRLVPGLHNMLKSHCPKGHEYTEENTYVTKSGARSCRECYREHWRNWNERRKQPNYVSPWREPAHGTTAEYQWGCRCEPCREAKSEDHKRRKRENK